MDLKDHFWASLIFFWNYIDMYLSFIYLMENVFEAL